MDAQRFFAENSQIAFQMVKEALGPDAVILSNRSLSNGVEIMAGHIDTISSSQEGPVVSLNPADQHQNQPNAISADLEALKRVMMSELSAIKIGSWENKDQNKYQLFQYFVKLGLHVSLVSKLTSDLDNNYSNEQNRSDVLQELVYSIRTGPGINIPVDNLTGIVMLHGMTGAGKTTTIAKIAAQAVAAHGNDDVVLVCADNKRMGAHQQLLGYGKILEIPVLQVRKTTELEEILSALKTKRLVLVDNAGITPDKLPDIEKTPAFQCSIPNVKHYLALSATTQATVLNRLLSASWKKRLEGIIVTKIDEAVQLGELISCLIENHAPAAFMCDGQNIQTDLYSFNSDELVARSVELANLAETSPNEEISNTVKTVLHKQLDFMH